MRKPYLFGRACALATICVCLFLRVDTSRAQDAASPRVVVRGSEIPSAYGAPPAFSRTRFAPTTTAYVLPPGAVLAATIYEGDFDRAHKPDHNITQEIEVGLPYRFGLAVELATEAFGDRYQLRAVSVEGRYALADWNRIPLNPTLFAEYKFGTGRVLHEEGAEEEEDEPAPGEDIRKLSSKIGNGHSKHTQEDGDEDGDEGEEGGRPSQPDAVEGRLLLAQDFGDKIEWALNGFIEQETSGDRGREWGFAQSIVTPLVRKEVVKVGVEMLYTNFTDKDSRDDPSHRFVVGPTIAWKPSRWSRVDVSPLFGVTEDSPTAQVFVVFSMLFGGSSKSGESEAPASTRNR